MASVLDIIKHYQQVIEKYSDDEGKVLRCIDKLFQLKVTVQHLQETGVGRTVNALRKEPGEIGQAARALVLKWKTMVAAEESDQEGDHKTDTPTQNGHGSGRDSDDHMQQTRSSNDQYNKSSQSTPKSNHTNHKESNGHHSGSKRKYHSSEDEDNHDSKKKYRHTSSSEDDHNKQVVIKKEKLSDSESSDDDSESSDSDSDSYSSESSRETVKVKTEIKQEIKQEIKKEKESPDRDKSSKHSHSNHVDHKRDSSRSKTHDSDTHSHHKASHKEARLSSEASSKSSSNKHKSSHEKENSTDKRHKSDSSDKRHKTSSDEKRHKSDTSSDEKKESKSSSMHSSNKHKSSSHKHESGSERSKSSSDKHSSKEHKSSSHTDKTQEKLKTSSDKDMAKHKSKESSSSSSKEKHSSSSKDKSKERSSSSKDRSNHNHSEKKHSSGDSKSHSSDKSKHRSDEGRSEKRSKDKSSSSSSHKSKLSSSSSKSKEDVPKKKSKLSNSEDSGEDGIDCGSGASFAEALGMISPTKPKKKLKDVNSPSNSFNNDLSPAALLAPTAKLAPLPALEISALPEISPNYKPRPPPKLLPHFTDEDAISAGISSKNQRTKVYSGNKVIGKITSLYEMCVQVLQEHIDALEYTGGVPYDILKPVVDRASPQQLYLLEHYNPYLMDDTDHLWKKFCDKSFRNKKRQELESWREMFMRCQEEQEHKLKSLTANIKLTQEAKKAPIKQTKMAYVDSVVKPPRNVARKQAVHGTAHTASASPAARVASLAATPGVQKGGPRPPPAASVSASAFNKPKKAPLMQKALQFMRGRKR